MKVILVDDHQAFRESLRVALSQHPDIEVLGDASTGREACALMERLHPDLAVLDLTLPDTDGISLVRELRRRGFATPVMILTMHHTPLFVRDALEAGAQGYALKEQPLVEVIEAMHAVAKGARYLPPSVGALPEGAGRKGEGLGGLDTLSKREREIFSLVVQGRASTEIAKLLSISLKTVETHRSHINRKLGVHSGAELVRLAAVTGLLGGARAGSIPEPR
jgi:two-component system, NarL family, response regulator NreC